MSDTKQTPKPTDSGSDGSQVENDEIIEFDESNYLPVLPLAGAMNGIAASNSKAFGSSEVASAMVLGITNQLNSDLNICRLENRTLQAKLETERDIHSKAKANNAVLKERILSFHQHRHLRNIAIAIGTTMLIGSIKLFSTQEYHDYGYVSLIFGALLVVIAWFLPVRGGDE